MKKNKGICLMGRKEGMTHVFDENGNITSCTVIKVSPNVICQIKNQEKDGYDAIQLGYNELVTESEQVIKKRLTKPCLGHIRKATNKVVRKFKEVRDFSQVVGEVQLGQELNLGLLKDVLSVDVQGVSKGKGFQGVMKRYGFRGGPASHGSGFHRHGGSTGMRSTPGRCLPGTKKAGQMGNKIFTIKNLLVLKIEEERDLLFLKGAIPGGKNSWVAITSSDRMFKRVKNKRG